MSTHEAFAKACDQFATRTGLKPNRCLMAPDVRDAAKAEHRRGLRFGSFELHGPVVFETDRRCPPGSLYVFHAEQP